MEKRDTQDSQWPFSANPTSQNHQLSSPIHRPQIDGSHFSSSPNLYQTHAFFQNQSYPMNQILRQFSQQVDEGGLEDSFSRMNLSVSSHNNHGPLYHDRFYGHSNSTSSLATQNMWRARSENFLGPPMANNFDFNLQPRSNHSFGEFDFACRRRWIKNSDLQRYWGNTWAVDGLESENASFDWLYSNHPAVYPQERSNYSSLEELKGMVSSMAKDQNGSRFLQKKFDRETINPQEIEMIFGEVKNRLHELMVHPFANYLIQKLFEVGSLEQRTELLLLVVSDERSFQEVCTDEHGSRAVQKFMERISTQEQRYILLSMLRPIAVILTNNIHGHHIIEQCMNKFSNEDTKHLVNEIVNHCLDIAINKSGCCVLQQCLAHARTEDRERLLTEITANAVLLSEHPYGNYVVQYVLGMRIHHVTSNIILQLGGSYVTLSMNKYGSNVVEKCLKDAGERHSAKIIKELMHDTDFLKVLQDPFGNYVAQSALLVSKGELHNSLVKFIQHYDSYLHSHPFGKKVLARTKWRKNRV